MASLNFYGVASSEFVASSHYAYDFNVASSNFKDGFYTVTTKFGLCAIATLYEIGLHESGRVASTSFSGVASYSNDYGLRLASSIKRGL